MNEIAFGAVFGLAFGYAVAKLVGWLHGKLDRDPFED